MKNIPRPEHPRPQFMREKWINLNGEWEFEFDEREIGRELHFEKRNSLDMKITVPFCPESVLSGIGDVNFHNAVWYRKDIEIPEDWKGKSVILHFGAVDYHAIVYVNSELVGEHKGGYSSFEFDISPFLKDEQNYITVCAIDHVREMLPSGKQSERNNSYGCFYTRTTGIWQTVWLECAPKARVSSAKIFTDVQGGKVEIRLNKIGDTKNLKCKATAFWEGNAVGSGEVLLNELQPSVNIELSENHPWEIGKGGLYDLIIETFDENKKVDEIKSYFGLRSVDLRERAFCINGKAIFGRWVLDQGFYPDGIYTAPSDEALKNDIIYSQMLGFNGARLHEKIFEERFLYWADKLGYMVWGEHANWGYSPENLSELNNFLPEWMEALERDFNHPAIIGWCPFNETWANKKGNDGVIVEYPQSREVIETVYKITKALDKTRPVIDTSGNYHTTTDIFDVHDYEGNVEIFKENYAHIDEGIVNDQVNRSSLSKWQKYRGEPLFMSEYGGIGWDISSDGWGYGNAPKTEDEFFERYRGLTEAILNNGHFLGFCYTQLYDVEQEKNGLMTYDRKFKFDPKKFYEINTQIAEIEKE